MNELSNYLVETFLLQEAVTQKVVVSGGRFQPFHAGHYKTYKHLCSVFGAKNVYIASSNVQDSNKSPLSFLISHLFFKLPNKRGVWILKYLDVLRCCIVC